MSSQSPLGATPVGLKVPELQGTGWPSYREQMMVTEETTNPEM